MTENLILILGQSPDDPVRYAFVSTDATGVLLSDVARGVADLAEISERAANAKTVIAVLPGEQAAMRAVAAPPSSNTKFRAAAAYLLEDDLAEPLETLHIAIDRHSSGAGLALATKVALLTEWIEAFAEAGLDPDVITPDFATLPFEPDQAIFVFEEERIFGVSGLRGFALETGLAGILKNGVVDADQVTGIIAYGNRDDKRFTGEIPVEWRAASMAELFSDFARNEYAVKTSPNFRTGAYRKKHDWSGSAGAWRRAAMLAAACFVALTGAYVVGGIRDVRTAGKIENEIAALHTAAFPAAANVDPENHARGILNTRTDRPAFLPITSSLAEGVTESGAVQIQRIRYNAARGEYSVNLQFDDVGDLEVLKQSLTARGLTASETGGLRRIGDGYVGELRVSAS